MSTDPRPAAEQGSRAFRARDAAVALLCVGLGLAFGALVWLRRGPGPAQQYLSGYLIELSLSVDNVFVFALVFEHFGLDPRRERLLLLWGVAGAFALRSLLLVAGLGAISRYSWIIPLFGALILATGARVAFARPGHSVVDPSGPLFRFATRRAPAGLAAFFVLESADLVFALDSLPAVIAVTHDTLIAVSSNLFAILGLRALFFVVKGAVGRLRFLHAGLAAVLIFVGLKMLAEPWHKVAPSASLAVIGSLLALAAGASLLPGRAGPG